MSESAELQLWGKSQGDGLTVFWEPQLGAELSWAWSAGAGGDLSVCLLLGSLIGLFRHRLAAQSGQHAFQNGNRVTLIYFAGTGTAFYGHGHTGTVKC